MECPNCGAAALPDQRYCGSCGTRLGRACANCSAPLPDGVRFCTHCGTPVDDAKPTPFSPRSPTVERRLVSVLFVDLVGFTDLATKLDPEDVRDLQATYFDRAREIVERYGGTIEKFIGDAVMAVWGAPTSNEDDAERAVRAGLDLLAAVPTLRSPEPLGARAGVATGESAVTLGAQGQGMVAGDTVNLAARLQAAADPGTVRTDDATRRAAEAAIAFEPEGEQQLKGFDRPIATWRANRIVAGRAGSGRTDELEPPFVGRSAELTLLKELFHASARERRLRVVSITGQAGIGKSRLAWEFEKYIDGITQTVYWHQGRSPAYGEGIAFWALGEMVRRRAGILEGDDDGTTGTKLGAMLEEHVSDPAQRERLLPALESLLGLPCDARLERGELFGAWRSLFERLADEAPAVLVFEDLQWADAGLVDFIGHLLEWSRDKAIFVVTLARPELIERFPNWGAGQRNFTSLHLERLLDEDMRELLTGLVPGLPARTVRAILDRAEGVPLYAVETVRMLVADGHLVRDAASYRVEGSIDQVSIPSSLHALVAARLDGLDPGDRSILQQAAVLGTSFTIDALSAISGLEREAVLAALGRLAARDIVRLETDERSPERGQYQFVQSVIREVAYQTLTKKDRKERHLAAARYFESLGEEEISSVLACHYLDAWRATGAGAEGDALAAQARVALRGATDRSEALHSYEQALKFAKLGLEVAVDRTERAALLERAADAAQAAAHLDEGIGLIREAVDLQAAVADEEGLAVASSKLGNLLLMTGRNDEAMAVLEQAEQRAVANGLDGPGLVRVRTTMARVAFNLGMNARAIELADAVIPLAERLAVNDDLVDAMVTKGSALASMRPVEGLALLFGAIALADRMDLPRAGLRARNNAGATISGDDLAAWLELMRQSEAIAERLGLRDEVQWARTSIASRWLDLGETVEARRRFAEVLADETMPDALTWFGALDDALIAALEGDDERRLDRMSLADRTFPPNVSPQWRSAVLGVRAEISLLVGDAGTAATLSDEAVELDPTLANMASHAVRFNALSGRLDRARAAMAHFESLPDHGRLIDGWRAAGLAAIAAAEGDPGAVPAYLEAIRRWRAVQPILELSLTQLLFVLQVGLAVPEARAAAEELRATATAKGWHGVIARLDALAERPGTATGTEVAAQPAVPERA